MPKKLVVDVPDEVKAEFKLYCTKNGTTIHKEIVDFMQGAIDGEQQIEQIQPSEQAVAEHSSETEQPITSSVQANRAMDFNINAFRSALNLKELKKQEVGNFEIEDPLDIGL
jgi:hypothetical protein